MKTILLPSGLEPLLQKFREHLLTNQGLAQRTCAARLFYVREFLKHRFKSSRRKVSLDELTPDVLLNHVLERSRQDSPGRLQALASALRSFSRYLLFSGVNQYDLSSALPRIASPGRPLLPDYLKPEQLDRLLHSIQTNTPMGVRNYAIVLCLARLGLRAAEVAGLTLEQVHWRTGEVHLTLSKSRRERRLPLPQDVGRALVNYLRIRPSPLMSRSLFCGLRSSKPLCPRAISQVAGRALRQAGIQTNRPGAHLLRRTLASHLIQKGIDLKAVADLLGHANLDTTRIYTNVHQAMLLKVARPWPVEVRR